MKKNYGQGNYHTRNRSISSDKRTSFRDRGRGRYVQNYGQDYRQNYRGIPQGSYRNDFRRGNYRETQSYRGQNYRNGCRDNYKDNYRNDNFGRCRSRSWVRQNTHSFKRDDRSSSRSRSRSS